MTTSVKNIEIALILSGLKRLSKRNKSQQAKFEDNLERGYYQDKSEKQIKIIRRNKIYKERVIKNLIERLEQLLSSDECKELLSEQDYDWKKHITE